MVDLPNFDEYFLSPPADASVPEKVDYEILTRSLRNSLNAPDGIIATISDILKNATNEYNPPELLFVSNLDDLSVLVKPYDSVINKIYRKNVLWNKNWPEPPKSGWINSNNYLSAINDIFRLRLVCKYSDAPKYLCEALDKNLEGKSYYYPNATEQGYYSWHFYHKVKEEIPDAKGSREVSYRLEIQFATQLADALNQLTHRMYEKLREEDSSEADDEWQWKPSDPRFRATFAGHSIHLLEGILLEMKQNQFDKEDE